MQIPPAVGRVLSKLEANTRLSIGAAERQALNEIEDDDSAPLRSALARVMLEDWRNGWDEFATPRDRKAALRYAVGEIHRARTRRDRSHWYVDWKRGHVLRYAARAFDRPQDAEMIRQAYRDAYEKLSAFTGLAPKRGEKALRSLVVDWAETMVYFGDTSTALQYFNFTLPWKRREPDDWHIWAHAFALHQHGDYTESWKKMEKLVEKLDHPDQAAPAKQTAMIAQRANKKIHPSYYNDMRLTLAASYARDGKRQKAEAEVRKFQQFRQLSGDTPWTLALEAERGAFIRNSPAERHWLQSLRLAGLPEGRPVADSDEKKSAARKKAAKPKPKKKAGTKSTVKPKRKSKTKKSAATTKRKAPKRKTAKRPASKRKAPKRKSPGRKSPGRKSSKRKTKTKSRARTGSKATRRKR